MREGGRAHANSKILASLPALAYARAFATTRLLMQTVLTVPVSNRILEAMPLLRLGKPVRSRRRY